MTSQRRVFDGIERASGKIEHRFYCRLSHDGSGLMLVNELKGKTRRVQYIGTTMPESEFPDEFPVPSDELCRE